MFTNNPLIPIMTSNSLPRGNITYSGQYSSNYAYKAFDKNDATIWSAAGSDNYICYEFMSDVLIKRIEFVTYNGSGSNHPHNARFYSSLDGTEWSLIAEEYISDNYASQRNIVLQTAQKIKYIKYYPDTYTMTSSGNKFVTLTELQCYGCNITTSL